jgi:hypothetical protein
MSLTNQAAFDRAHEAYYRLPEGDDFDTCQDCEKGKIPNPDYDPTETDPAMKEDELCDCDECDGTGEINLSAIARREYQDAKEAKADYDFECQRDERNQRE